MSLEINQLEAGRVLRESYERVSQKPQHSCSIQNAVDAAMEGKNCLTYQYILLTALVAKLVCPQVDMMSLQADDASDGAYSPRTLCKDVVYPFQRHILCNALDGSNPDPFVNKPARYPRLSRNNAAHGDGKTVLNLFCDVLPELKAPAEIREVLDYMMTKLLVTAGETQKKKETVNNSVRGADMRRLYSFLSDLLDQGFGGASLVLAAYALFLIQFPEKDGYKVIPHPVNQPGASSHQRSDMDIELDGRPYIGVELKDKIFTADDVARASDTATESGLHSLLFISGRHTGLTSIPTYFSGVRKKYADNGFTVGVIEIDELMDFILVSSPADTDVPGILSAVYNCVSSIGGTVEMQTWVYSRLLSE